MEVQAVEYQRECTLEEGQRWQAQYSEGYRVARGDIRWNQPPRVALVAVPEELPFECGAQYVARHVGQAWVIGYTRAWEWELGRRAGTAVPLDVV